MPQYRPDGTRILQCYICECIKCEHYDNMKYDSPVCRFKSLSCNVCKGRHCITMCPDYKELPENVLKGLNRSGF